MSAQKEAEKELEMEARLCRLEELMRQHSQSVADTVQSLSAKLEAMAQFFCTHPPPSLPRPDTSGVGPSQGSCPPEPPDQGFAGNVPPMRQLPQDLHQSTSSDSSPGVQRPLYPTSPELQSSTELRHQSVGQTALGFSDPSLYHNPPHQPPSPACQLSQPNTSQPQPPRPAAPKPHPLQSHLPQPHPSRQPHPDSVLSSETKAKKTGAHSHLVEASTSSPHEVQQALDKPCQEPPMGSKRESGQPMVGSHITDVLTYNVQACMEQQSPFMASTPYKDTIVHSAKAYPEDWIGNTPVGRTSDDASTSRRGGGDGSASGTTAGTGSDTAFSEKGTEHQSPSKLTTGSSETNSSLGLGPTDPQRQGRAECNQDTSLQAAGGKASGLHTGRGDTAAEVRGPASKMDRNTSADEKSVEPKNPTDPEGDAEKLLGCMPISGGDAIKNAVQRAYKEEIPRATVHQPTALSPLKT